MLEKLEELWEQFVDQAGPQRWFQLFQKFKTFDKFGMIITISFPDEDLDLLIKCFTQTFIGPGVVQFDQPDIQSLEKHLLHINIVIAQEHIIDRAHNEREKGDSQEFDDHSENILLPGEAENITVADGCKRDHYPVECCDVFCKASVLQSQLRISIHLGCQPGPSLCILIVLPDRDPRARDNMHNEQQQEQDFD